MKLNNKSKEEMKKLIIMAAMAATITSVNAKSITDTLYVTTTPQMHCANCETKIKGNIRFEKGIKDIITSIPDQKVTVVYNPKKTDKEKIIKGFKKIGYTAREVKKNEKVKAMNMNEKCDNM